MTAANGSSNTIHDSLVQFACPDESRRRDNQSLLLEVTGQGHGTWCLGTNVGMMGSIGDKR